MSSDQSMVASYALFWLIRIYGCVRRGRQPLLRGRDWFFSVPVRPGFYTGPGRRILRRYWIRMMIPFAVDVPCVIAIFLGGRLALIPWLILGLCAIIHINHSYSVYLAERQAQAFSVSDAEPRAVRVATSLAPRRLRDYASPRFEFAVALSVVFILGWLIRYYLTAAERPDVRFVFGAPALMLYLQLGLLYAKKVALAWRSPLPQLQAEEHMEVREGTRRFYLSVCDWSRGAALAAMASWPIMLSTSRAATPKLTTIFAAFWMLMTVIVTVWIEIRRRQVTMFAVRMNPVKLPEFVGQPDIARWPLCFQPSAPMLMLKGARGYSLNLANNLSYVGAAYLAGFIFLFAALPKHH